MRLLAVLLAAAGLSAAPPIKVVTATAQVTLGPGVEPRLGDPPFRPRLEGQFTLSGLPKGARPTFRFWRATPAAAATLRPGRPIAKGAAGFTPVEGETVPLAPAMSYQVKAQVTGPWNGPETLVIEVRNRGRWVARGTASIVERNLPGAVRREGMEP